MRSLLIILLAPLGLVFLGSSPDGVSRYEVEPSSRFWIDGSATTGSYTCTSERLDGGGQLARHQVDGHLAVPVAAFDCGIAKMNRDFRDALRAERHPTIRFDLEQARVLGAADGQQAWVPVRAVGTLTLAGTTKRIAIRAEGQQLQGGRVRVRGSHPLLMSDFGIEPPSGLFGLVRAQDRIVARFDIIALPR